MNMAWLLHVTMHQSHSTAIYNRCYQAKLYKYNYAQVHEDVCTLITAGTRDKLLVEFYINCFANKQCPCAT